MEVNNEANQFPARLCWEIVRSLVVDIGRLEKDLKLLQMNNEILRTLVNGNSRKIAALKGGNHHVD
jgi:hypothetical protein